VRIASAKSPEPRQKRWMAFLDETCRIKLLTCTKKELYRFEKGGWNMRNFEDVFFENGILDSDYIYIYTKSNSVRVHISGPSL